MSSQKCSYIGKKTPLSNSADKANGSMQYACDLHLPRMLQMKLITSPVAHGIVHKINAERAFSLPGVRAVLTFENTPSIRYNRGRVRANKSACDQETLFTGHVRHVGDRIGAVVADTYEIAEKAVSLITCEIEELPLFLSPEETQQSSDLSIFHESDCITEMQTGYGEDLQIPEDSFEFHHHSSSDRVTHMTMETHCAVADYHPGTNTMTVWSGCQSVFGVRNAIHTLFPIPMSHIRAIKTPMGGSFGCKQEMILEPLAACASYMTHQPVMLRLNRQEQILCTVLRHPVQSDVTLFFTPDKKISAVDLDVTLDAGAYQTVSPDYCGSIYSKLSWTYDIPKVNYHASSVCTNTPVSGGYRAWGSPEAAFILENAMNAAANKFGMDPIDLRLLNILPPYSTSRIGNFNLGNCRCEDCLVKGRERFHWDERRKNALKTQNSENRYIRGVGMALAVHTSGYFPRRNDWASVVLKLEEDGTVTVNCNVHDHGCGSVTAFQLIAGEVLGMRPDLISIPEADSLYNFLDNGCYTSRSVYVTGKAVHDASEQLLICIKEVAAAMCCCAPEDIRMPQRDFDAPENSYAYVISPDGREITYSEIAYYAADFERGEISVKYTHKATSNPGPAGAGFAEVEIDTMTGQCRLTDYLAVHDIGQIINLSSCKSQVGSAVQQALGMVLCEKIRIDDKSGRVINTDMQHYHVARSCDLPKIDVMFLEEPDENGPYGAKSIGEAALVPVTAAILAAVNHALGTDITSLPLTPEVIIDAIRNSKCKEDKSC